MKILLDRVAAFFAVAAFVSGCVTTATPTHNLSAESVRALRLERVDLVLSPSAKVHWPSVTDEWMKSRGLTIPGAPRVPREIESAELRAHLAAELRGKARGVIEPSLKSALSGSRPVIARLTVNHVYVPTFGEGLANHMFFGSHTVKSGLRANLEVLDARTGAVVLPFPDTAATTEGGYKLDMGTSGVFSHDPIERLMAAYNGQLTPWLLKS